MAVVVNRKALVLRDFARGFKIAKDVILLKKAHSTEVSQRVSPPPPDVPRDCNE
jgi:hypothetical protein